MSLKTDANKELLKKVCVHLGREWFFNEILTDKSNYDLYLGCKSGLVIHIFKNYGCNLPQWSLCYRHPTDKRLITFASVGCSLNKEAKKIAQDITNRLLSNTGDCFKKLFQLTEEVSTIISRDENNTLFLRCKE